ncbi:MAG TPA: hypothetical protein VFU02_07220, partial [Polyangiaceae bacterium]|nr:hypothetical protein [Polyangiaceae bacterium]
AVSRHLVGATGGHMTSALERALTAMNAWWFAPSARYQLGVFRVILVGWFGWYYWARLFERLRAVADRPLEFYAPPSLARWLSLPPLSQASLGWLEPLALGLLALAFAGIVTRASLIAFAALNLYLGLSANSWGYTAHASALPTLVLWLIAFAPGVTSFSLDAAVLAHRPHRTRLLQGPRPVSVWPVRAVLLVLCLVYVSAGVSKLRYSGWSWTDGQTLAFYLGGGSPRGKAEEQRFVADRRASEVDRFREGWGLVDHAYVGSPSPAGLWLSKQPGLLSLIAWAALMWELGFVIALFGGWARLLALAGGIGFHLGIYLTLGINFSSYLVCYAVFVDWRSVAGSTFQAVRVLSQRWSRRRAQPSS